MSIRSPTHRLCRCYGALHADTDANIPCISAHSHSRSDATPDLLTHVHAYANPDCLAYAYANPDCLAHTHTYSSALTHAYAYSDALAHAYTGTDRNADTDGMADAYRGNHPWR